MFGKKLKLLRKSNGYSMDKLAEIYNAKFNGKLNKSTLSRYENGLQEPIFTVVKNFAQLFSVSTDYLTDVDDVADTDENNTFKMQLKQLREDRKLSQSQLAEFLGTSRETIGDLESGTKEPDFETISKTAKFFDVSVDYILNTKKSDSPLNRSVSPAPSESVGVTIMAFDGDGQEHIQVTREQYNKIKKLLEIMEGDI